VPVEVGGGVSRVGDVEPQARDRRLWHEAAAGGHAEDRTTIHHPDIGQITVDCDVLNDTDTDTDTDTDRKMVVYTAPGSEDQTKLDLVRVAGPRVRWA
jgi:MmyB-like transcription regulator ligand binding domain